jgi:penicillin-binding protein activator
MRLIPIVSSLAIVFAFGCGPKRTVTRTGADSTEGGDLSGYWNDIDAEQVAKAMVQQCMESPWASNFQESSGGTKPVVKLMGVIKKTDDRNVNTDFFAKQLERTLLNSGRVRVVAAYGQDSINVAERDRQATHASDETAKTHQNETGADFTLQTWVNSQNETDGGGKSVRAYLVNMELVNVETNEKVWIGEHRIRKLVNQDGTSW